MFLSRDLATIRWCTWNGSFLPFHGINATRKAFLDLLKSGWILVGFYFFNDSSYYFEINDLVLT